MGVKRLAFEDGIEVFEDIITPEAENVELNPPIKTMTNVQDCLESFDNHTDTIASQSQLGHVRIGDNINITSNGTIGVPTMIGATSASAGGKGIVPAPSAGDQDKYLKGDGTWVPLDLSNKMDIDGNNAAETVSFHSKFCQGSIVEATGEYSHAEGYYAFGAGDYSHAEGEGAFGRPTIAQGRAAHAEGYQCTGVGDYSHVEGYGSTASGQASHAEGYRTEASAPGAHGEGLWTVASGSYSHAEGWDTTASDMTAHAEGYHTIASGDHSHAAGEYTNALGKNSHAEGYQTTAENDMSHAEGEKTHAYGVTTSIEHQSRTASGLLPQVSLLTNPTTISTGERWTGGIATGIITFSYPSVGSFDVDYITRMSTSGSIPIYIPSFIIQGRYDYEITGSNLTTSAQAGFLPSSMTVDTQYFIGSSQTLSNLVCKNTVTSEKYTFSIQIRYFAMMDANRRVTIGVQRTFTSFTINTGGEWEGGLNLRFNGGTIPNIIQNSSTVTIYGVKDITHILSIHQGMHAEGYATTAGGNYSHAEGFYSNAVGDYSHALGYRGKTDKDYFEECKITKNINSVFAIGGEKLKKLVPIYTGSSSCASKVLGGMIDNSNSNIVHIDGRGNIYSSGAHVLAEGQINGVLVANGPTITLEPGAGYILYTQTMYGAGSCINKFRGAQTYYIAQPWAATTTAGITTTVAKPQIAQMSTVGTVGCRISTGFAQIGLIGGDSFNTGTIGIGSCTTACHVRWSLVKVMGSEEDF